MLTHFIETTALVVSDHVKPDYINGKMNIACENSAKRNGIVLLMRHCKHGL